MLLSGARRKKGTFEFYVFRLQLFKSAIFYIISLTSRLVALIFKTNLQKKVENCSKNPKFKLKGIFLYGSIVKFEQRNTVIYERCLLCVFKKCS